MLKLNSITFKDEETGKIIEIGAFDGNVTSNKPFSIDEYTICKFHTGFLISGGISELKKFIEKYTNVTKSRLFK